MQQAPMQSESVHIFYPPPLARFHLILFSLNNCGQSRPSALQSIQIKSLYENSVGVLDMVSLPYSSPYSLYKHAKVSQVTGKETNQVQKPISSLWVLHPVRPGTCASDKQELKSKTKIIWERVGI